jgi:hypothetical protein
MPDGPYLTPDELTLQRMLSTAATPEAAGRSLIERLQALEAAVAAVELSEGEPDGENTTPEPPAD